jgi:hypothetical protein
LMVPGVSSSAASIVRSSAVTSPPNGAIDAAPGRERLEPTAPGRDAPCGVDHVPRTGRHDHKRHARANATQRDAASRRRRGVVHARPDALILRRGVSCGPGLG